MPATADWKRYVLDDPDGVVYPTAIHVVGDAAAVDNPEGLRRADGVGTTIRSSGLPQSPTPTLTVDLGVNTGGVVEVGVLRSDGTPFRIGYSEGRRFLRAAGDIQPKGNLPTTFGIDDDPDNRNDVFRPTAGTTALTLQSPAVRGAQRWLHLQVEGEGSVTLDFVRVAVTHARPDYDGWFHSSDDVLNRVWFASAYTNNVATVRDVNRRTPFVYVDGAKRDRLIWNMDAVRAEITGYYLSERGAEYARNTLNALACQQRADGLIPPASQISITCPENDPGPPDGPPPGSPPPDILFTKDLVQVPAYSSAWVIGLYEYWRHTGDDEFVRPLMPVARRALRFFDERLVGGLFPAQTQGPEITWHIDPAAGFDTYTNMTYFEALEKWASVERVLGDTDRAGRYDRDAQAMRKAIFARLWDPAAEAFVVNDVNPLRNHTSDVNVLAAEVGLVKGDAADRLLDYVARTHHSAYGTLLSEYPEGDPTVSQFNATYVMSPEVTTRFAHGDASGALRVLRTGYKHMVDSDPGTIWERIGVNGGPWFKGPDTPDGVHGTNNFTSLAHPMASAVPGLSSQVLGISPQTPGYETWRIAPQAGDLTFAQGAAPTPHGQIAARWERAADTSSFRLTVDGPGNRRGTVRVPLLGADRTIAMDGRAVWDGTRAVGNISVTRVGDAVEFTDVRGTHTFAWAEEQPDRGAPLVRKNVVELSAEERAAFVRAVKRLKVMPSPYDTRLSYYDQFVEWHLSLYRCSGLDLPATAGHGGAFFLPWHRVFVRLFEQALRQVTGKSIAVPYWDWSSPDSVAKVFTDDFMGGNGDPGAGSAVMTGPFRKAAWSVALRGEGEPNASSYTPYIVRRFGSGTTPTGAPIFPLPPVGDVQWALSATAYDAAPFDMRADPNVSFRNAIEGWWRARADGVRYADPVDHQHCGPERRAVPSRDAGAMHNRVHSWVAGVADDAPSTTVLGTMMLSTSPSDPVFFLNHANIDRLWAKWQAAHPDAGFVPAALAHTPIEPFGAAGHYTPASSLDVAGLGYRYSDFVDSDDLPASTAPANTPLPPIPTPAPPAPPSLPAVVPAGRPVLLGAAATLSYSCPIGA